MEVKLIRHCFTCKNCGKENVTFITSSALEDIKKHTVTEALPDPYFAPEYKMIFIKKLCNKCLPLLYPSFDKEIWSVGVDQDTDIIEDKIEESFENYARS